LKQKDRLAVVSPKSNLVFWSGGFEGGSVDPPPAPTKQTQRAEAGGE
jgi:hypothetical protein